MKTKEKKRHEAQIRQDAVKNVPAAQRLALLDKNGFTAKWERTKLAKLLITESEGRIAKVVIPGVGNQRPEKKNYQKPKRS